MRHALQAPNQDSLCYKDLYETWEEKHFCKVITGTRETFTDLFDDDELLSYEPSSTAALIFVGGDEQAEKAALEVGLISANKAACTISIRSPTLTTLTLHMLGSQACKEAEIEVIAKDSQEQKPTEYLAQVNAGQV